MVRFGQEKNRNSGLRSNDRNYPRRAIGDSHSPFGQGGGSESDSGGGDDFRCYKYWMRFSLSVKYDNTKVEKTGEYGEPDFDPLFPSEVTFKMEGKESLASEFSCEHAIDLPIENCAGCEYEIMEDSFKGTICPYIKTESLSDFVQRGDGSGKILCVPDNNCVDTGFRGACRGKYELKCRKQWLQCGKNEYYREFMAEFGMTMGIKTHTYKTKNKKAAWAVLKMIDGWKSDSGSDAPECDICDFLCCIGSYFVWGVDGGTQPKTQDCYDRDDYIWSWGHLDYPHDTIENCLIEVDIHFADFLLRGDSMGAAGVLKNCRDGVVIGNAFHTMFEEVGCPGCCGEDSGQFK